MKEEKFKVNSQIRLKDDLVLFTKVFAKGLEFVTFKKGHEFFIYENSSTGSCLMDLEGNRVDYHVLTEDKFELIENKYNFDVLNSYDFIIQFGKLYRHVESGILFKSDATAIWCKDAITDNISVFCYSKEDWEYVKKSGYHYLKEYSGKGYYSISETNFSKHFHKKITIDQFKTFYPDYIGYVKKNYYSIKKR